MGKRALKWDEVEQDQVIRIFANHFLREAEQRQAERDLVDGILAVTKWV
jgi:hypothetical protein